MLIGYARVSTEEQNLNLQKDALLKIGCERIYEEKKSGAGQQEILDRVLEDLRPNDTLIVWRLDRLGRSIKKLLTIIQFLENKKVNFKSINENIDTTTASGKLIFHVFAALAEFEKNIIRERTHAGLSAARARGKKGGRPTSLNAHKIAIVISAYQDKKTSIKNICQTFKISKPTLYKYLRKNGVIIGI